MDKLRALTYFSLAASERSFSAAARSLGLSTVAVARLVGLLERELGTVLFERAARGLLLTAAGARYLEASQPALQALRDADEDVRAFGSRPKGILVVAVQHVMARGCLTPALPLFHAQHPEITLDVREVHRVTEEEAASVDVMVAMGWPKLQNVVQRRIGAGRFVAVASPAYWSRHGMPRHPDELKAHACLALRGIDGTLMDVWSFARGAEQVSVTVGGWLTANNSHGNMLLDLAIRGQGIMRALDWSTREELASGALVAALPDWRAVDVPPVNLLYRPGMRRMGRARVFMDFVTGLFRDIDCARDAHVEPTERPAWLRRSYGKASNAALGGRQRD